MSKTLVITGASRGIGREVVQLASAAGHIVYALSRHINPIQKIPLVHPIAMDITDENALSVFAGQLQKEQIQIDALINNAGVPLAPEPIAKKEDNCTVLSISSFPISIISFVLLISESMII